MTRGRTAATAAALAATLGLAGASWVVAVRQMNGMDMGAATELGSYAFFVALWVSMMAAMMLPGATPAVLRHAHASSRVRAVPLFVGSYLAVWTVVGVVVYALYRPHGSFAAGAVAIAAGVYEFTPLKQNCRRRCRESVRSGFQFGRYCVGSSIGLMLMLVALGVMSVTLDVRDRRPRPRPEAPALKSRHRCAAGAGDHRTWNPDRPRALVGSWTHATDVRRHRWRARQVM
jgi:predicted metal-binding membrane protein